MARRIKSLIATEKQEHLLLMQWIRRHKLIWDNIFHIPNESRRTQHYGHQLQLMGMKKGVSDFILLIPNKRYHGLCLELKRTKGGVISADQQYFLNNANKFGYLGVVAYGFDEAKKVSCDYLIGFDLHQS